MSKNSKVTGIKKSNATSLFNLAFYVIRDKQKRGLWICFQDKSEARRDAVTKRYDDAFNRWIKRVGIKNGSEAISASLALHTELGTLLRPEVDEACLLGWEQLEEIYKAIGAELKKHKSKRGE